MKRSPDVRRRNVTHNILVQNLRNVQSATNAVLGMPVHIPIITVPDEIKKAKPKSRITDAMVEIDFADRDSLQLLEMKSAAYFAYDLGSPAQLGLKAFDWDAEIYESVVIDYNVAYLSLYLVDIGETRAFRRAHATFADLGENAIREDRATVGTDISARRIYAYSGSQIRWLLKKPEYQISRYKSITLLFSKW